VPHGYVCGYPLHNGDMYGGAHYIQSASSDLTPQGRAIQEAAVKFGDGKSLPFPPCKRYYNPYSVCKTTGRRRKMYACRLHNELRMKRVSKEGRWRDGEKQLDWFWNDDESDDANDVDTSTNIVGGTGKVESKATPSAKRQRN
jgi:hypothetical protein